jgi:CheY-like chemotaxis protein
VIKASNLTDALALAHKLKPDLIITDVIMPGGSGFDLVMTLKADPDLRHIPVILITSLALTESDRQRGLECGAVRYIMRPIEPQALLAQVEECLRETKKDTLADILVVDDRMQNLDVLRSVLEPSGYTVRVAQSASEAFDLARQRPPDLILTDIHMPAADGISLVRALRGDPQLHATRIALNSASFASAQERADAEALGVSIYITRPVEPETLLAEVKALLKAAKGN